MVLSKSSQIPMLVIHLVMCFLSIPTALAIHVLAESLPLYQKSYYELVPLVTSAPLTHTLPW